MSRQHQHWAQIRESTSIAGIRFLLGTYRLMGRGPFRLLLVCILLYYWVRKPLWRQSITKFHRHVSKKEKISFRTQFTHMMRFGETILDKFLAASGELHAKDLYVENADIFHNDSAQQGAILLTSHMGCQELLGVASLTHTPHPIVVLQATHHAKDFQKLLQKAGLAKSHLHFLEIHVFTPQTAMRLDDWVQKGAYIVIAGDRTPVQHSSATMEHVFLDDLATWPTGGAYLAMVLHVPLRMMTCTRTECPNMPRYRVRFVEISSQKLVSRAQRTLYLQDALATYVRRLENEVRQHPYDWFNFFSFWKESQ